MKPRGSAIASCVLACFSLLLVFGAAADERFELKRTGRVFLDDVVAAPAGEPLVELYLRAETVIGEPLEGLTPSSLVIRDSGEFVESARIELEMLAETGRGTCSVLVLDTSRTMRGEPFEQAKAAAQEFLQRMGEFDRVAVISFDDDVEVVSSLDAPRTETRLAIEQLVVQPKTLSKLAWDGVGKAVDQLRARPSSLPRRAFVLVFSDGRDSNSVRSLPEVIDQAVGGPGQGRIPVFSIGYSRFGGTGLDGLRELASRTGGSFFQAFSPGDLSRFFDEIWNRMTHSYVVRYKGDMDGKRHTIEVTVQQRSDSRDADYPEIGTAIWPFLLAFLLLLAAAGGAFFYAKAQVFGRLNFEGGPRSGQSVTLRGRRLRIGALEDNDLILNYPTVSRYHARIQWRGGRLEIEDLGSRNGTFVNGTSLRTAAELQSGDRLRFGDVEMTYRK